MSLIEKKEQVCGGAHFESIEAELTKGAGIGLKISERLFRVPLQFFVPFNRAC